MVWLIGNMGMLGQQIEKLLLSQSIAYVSSDMDVDITDFSAVEKFTENKDLKWIINCAAYTAVDNAEDDKEKAFAINATGPENLAKISSAKKVKLIHISTDYVFPGTEDRALNENDITGPVSVYGKTKLDGETKIIENTKSYFIIRTAWLYGKYGNNFVYTMLALMNNRNELMVVNDQVGTPTYAKDLAELIFQIIRRDSELFGIYHFSNEGRISWYDFAIEINRQGLADGIIQNDCRINKCESSQFPTKAVRPNFSLLSKEKVKKELSIVVNDWKVSLTAFFTENKKMMLSMKKYNQQAKESLVKAKEFIEKQDYSSVVSSCRSCLRFYFISHSMLYTDISEDDAEITVIIKQSRMLLPTNIINCINDIFGNNKLSQNISKDTAEMIIKQTEEITQFIKRKNILNI